MASNSSDGPADSGIVELLWTSGWDSTFRLLCALFLEDVSVRPHYIVDRDRASYPAELRAMTTISEALALALPEAAGRLLPTITVERDEIPPHPQSTEMFASLAARGPIGSQYDWLARYTLLKGLDDLELSIHRDDRANAYLVGNVTKVREQPFAAYRLAPAARGSDLDLFANFVFPIFDLSKVDMREHAARHGFLDILELSWFCHKPRAGDVPCGICNPCRDAVAEGVGYRLPRGSRIRQVAHGIVPWTKVTDKFFRR